MRLPLMMSHTTVWMLLVMQHHQSQERLMLFQYHQLIYLATTFWCMAIAIDSGYMLLASRLQPLLGAETSAKLRGRITGFFLFAAGAGLALIPRK